MSKKIALVFGGTRGIGAATVQKLAEGGFEVAYTYVSSAPNVPAKIAGASTKGYQVDIREAAQVAQVFTDVARVLWQHAALCGRQRGHQCAPRPDGHYSIPPTFANWWKPILWAPSMC